MEFRLNSVYRNLLLLLGIEILCVAGATSMNRCDKNIEMVTKSTCFPCSVMSLIKCPSGYSKKPSGKSESDCRYSVSIGLSFAGCSFECSKDTMEPQCCPGYWGNDCIECPESAASPCSNNGVCSDGMGGNGTCTCKTGFVGTACEDCRENLYGQACNNVCQCKHGLCDSGVKGTGQCTCLSGYTGIDCSQELPACAALRCGPDARCIEEISKSQLVCKCKPGYQGDGVRCTSINPCSRSVCHANAACAHTGPNQHVCTCAKGYSGDGHVCMPIDPCQTNFGDCPSSSTRCVYDGPGKSHCECLEGFAKYVERMGCRIKDVCRPDSCHKYATCATVVPGTVECKCRDGYLGNGKICLGNIIQQLQELNSGGDWTGQLSSAISLFDKAMSWPLTSLGPFTVFVPVNKAFKGTSVKTLLANEMKARYLAKLHMVAGEVNFDSLKKGILYYTLTGLAGESLSDFKQIKIRLHGSRKRAAFIDTDIFASNGIIHLVDKLMDTVPSTVISEKEENLLQILSKNGKFSQFKSLLEKTNMAAVLESQGPYTLFAPTNPAFTFLKTGYLDYLSSEEGKNKLLELMRNHIISNSQLSASYIASNSRAMSLANQALTFNVTASGQMLVNGEVMLELDVEAANGRLHSVEGVLIPASIEPVLPHRCDLTENNVYRGPCVSCKNPSKSICPTGERMFEDMKICVYRLNNLESRIPLLTSGCAYNCNETKTTPLCCKGFFGPDCSPCPGGFTTPCSSRGKCSDGIDGKGTCQCEPNFKGSRCQYCANPNKYGSSCDKTCGCIQGVCDNRPEASGTCKVGSCKDDYTGEFCEQQRQRCGANQPCHAHADCVPSIGTIPLYEICVCKPGFKGDGYMCVERDPCVLPNRGGCSINAKCIKTGPGTHRCQCLSGWREDGDECQLINDCLDPSRGGCHPNATCIYVGPGQSDCACKNGYHGDGRACEPMNQCVGAKGGCHYLATCQFMGQDGWRCVCEDDYAGDGIICYGSLAQEVATNPELLEFNKWVTLADVSQLLSEAENCTLFIPSAQAIENMSKDDKDFWLSRSNLPSLIKNHIIPGIFRLTDLRTTPSPKLASLLKRTLQVSSTNDSTIVAGGKVLYGDMVAQNGVIHLIDTVLISERQSSTGLLEVLDQTSDLSIFRDALTKHNMTDILKEYTGFTIFAPTDSAIQEYLKRTGEEILDLNVTQYHIIVNEIIKEEQLMDGLYKDTLLGFSYQLGFFRKDNKLFVNDAEMNTTNIETNKGVIHTVSAVLSIPNNRCDRESTALLPGRCMDCFRPAEDICPSGTKRMTKPKSRCMYTRVHQEETLLTIGCQFKCVKVTIKRQCCAGYHGINCERCPGPEAQPCFGNGICADGTNGTGVCRCNQNFYGTACENCQRGRYGIHCDQECKCVHGRCKDGTDGDGSCQCDLGWRGITCNLVSTSDMCGGKCHSSANCPMNEADSTYYCKCAAGFQGNGTHCTAVDACAEKNGGCDARALCKRTDPGQRICVCPAGYAGDGTVCIPINPCLNGNNGGCDRNANCIHTGPNKATCVCKTGFTMVENNCEAINVCRMLNGGCHRYARCTMTGPLKRNCTCESGYIGDGEICRGSLQRELTNRRLREFLVGVVISRVSALRSRGPFTVFAPTAKAFEYSVDSVKTNSELFGEIIRYHIVPCRSLLPEDLMQPRNLTTLMGEVLSITNTEDAIYINSKSKIVFSNLESSNGILHEIDNVLIPPSLQNLKARKEDNNPRNLSDVVNLHGFKTFYKLLEDTDVLKLVTDKIYQPVTLFLPTDDAMAALAQEQKDFLYAMHNREKLAEYLRFHILHDALILPSDLMRSSSLRTQQGSDLSVACVGEEQIGEFYVNDKSCRIVKRNIKFNGGIIYGINCLLNPLSLGGRCDITNTVDITLPCRRCGRTSSDCPPGSRPKHEQKCDLTTLYVANADGCQSICTMVIWKPKCCSGYFGRDCLACPGGPGSPCSNQGKCDEDHLGNGTCTCDAGFTGVACELCVDGHFGPDCIACNCTEHGSCDQGMKGTGSCFCDEGWTGSRCENKLADVPVCSPACHKKAVCMEDNTCVCKPFYEGDGITCTAANMCKYWNGGCSKDAKCTQKEEKVSCACLKSYSGDGFVCTPIDPCVTDDNGGCHEHATCTMTGPDKRKCECKDNYIGDGIECELKLLPVNRCLQDYGHCHSDAQCTDLHHEDKSLGVFHYRSPIGAYKLNYTMAQEACKETGGTIATYIQLSYAQQAGYNLCSAGWLEKARVAYPMSFSNQKCGFGHVGIVDYGTRNNLSETWDVFCYRVNDVKCECKIGYIGDGYSCTGNLLQVLSTQPTFSNFYSQIQNYSSYSASGKEFVNRISNITIQSTLFVPENNGLYSNQTLSSRDIEHHLLDGRALILQALINITHIRTRLGQSLTITRVPDLQNPQTATSSGYIDDQYVIDYDIFASNGVIHVLQGPLKAPPLPPPTLHPAHKAGVFIGVLVLIILITAGGFVGYNFYTHKTKPFQFHYFKDDGVEVNPSEPSPNITNPVYESTHAPKDQAPTEDKHEVISSGSYDLLQDS